jgi:hypothetical protein
MHSSRLYAWILLAVPNEGERLPYVLSMADGLNRTLPDPDELRDALGWLHAAGMIVMDSDRYRRTDEGRALIADNDIEGENAFQLWDRLARALERVPAEDAAPLPVSPDTLKTAYDEYNTK